MKALRLRIHQSSANYKKEETVDNKMTYPLPPPSTIIGAIHAACGYKEYHPMDISIQGRYESMHREPYTDCCFLNSVQDDRGILVKMKNGSMLSNAFEKIASAKKPQGNSFRNNITIQVHDQKLLDEYRQLKDLNDKISEFKKERLAPVINLLKKRKKRLSEKKKSLDKNNDEYKLLLKREKELKETEKIIKSRMDKYQQEYYIKPISRYRSLITSLKFYEILNDIELIIHISADSETLDDIQQNIYNLTSIGRSEDIVNIEEIQLVELLEDFDEEVKSDNSAYIEYDMIKKERIFLTHIKTGKIYGGTKYYLNKKYKIIDGKRRFEKKKVLYLSQYAADEFGDGLYLDKSEDRSYIVNFL